MKEEWLKDPLAGYEENAKHLFSYPDSTMHEYGLDLRRFLKWLEERQVEGAEDGKTVVLLTCNRERIEDYIACLSSEGLKATTINRKIFSLNSFYVWAVHHQLMPVSPLVGVRKLKIPRRIPKFLTFEDIEKLLTYTGSIRDRKKPWWRLFVVALMVLAMTPNAASQPDFPTLQELEKLLPEAPELQAIVLEIEQLRLEASWTRHINFHTSYSQHFASYVPVLSPSDRKISGDTLVLGVSASIALDELVQGRKKARLALRLKQVEYQRVYQAKLAALRVLYANRDRLREHVTALQAQAKTAGLKLERVRAGIQFDFLGFNAIDLAEAEEGVARLEVGRRQTEIEIESIETRILEVVGRGASGP